VVVKIVSRQQGGPSLFVGSHWVGFMDAMGITFQGRKEDAMDERERGGEVE
jgi:hypothetical protein